MVAIEVKARDRFHAAALRGLRAVAGLPVLTCRLLVHTGLRAQTPEDGIDAMPVGRFLELIEGDLVF